MLATDGALSLLPTSHAAPSTPLPPSSRLRQSPGHGARASPGRPSFPSASPFRPPSSSLLGRLPFPADSSHRRPRPPPSPPAPPELPASFSDAPPPPPSRARLLVLCALAARISSRAPSHSRPRSMAMVAARALPRFSTFPAAALRAAVVACCRRCCSLPPCEEARVLPTPGARAPPFPSPSPCSSPPSLAPNGAAQS